MRVGTRLLLVIATCLLPILILQAAVSWSQWNERRNQLDILVLHQTELLAGDADSIAEGARILLSAAAEFDPIRKLNSDCSARLAAMRDKLSSYAFIVLVDTGGQIRCSSSPELTNAPAGEQWIQDAEAATAFDAGRFARLPGHASGFLPFYLPIEAGDPTMRVTLVAALDLGWLSQHLLQLKQGSANLLSGGVLSIADRDGVILARNPQPDEFVGQRLPPAAMPIVRATAPGQLRLKSIDGTERVVGFIPPSAANHNLVVAVGFYEPDLMGDINRALLRSGILLAIAALAAVVFTWIVARRFIARPTRSLLLTTQHWREGDLTARAPDAGQDSEFGAIAAACNDMAAALAKREDELREHTESLEARVAERTHELLLTNNRLQVEIAERQNTEAALAQSQKLQAVGQLAGGIAHDFNNLLATIQGSLDLLDRTIPETQERQHVWIERASGAVLRGSQLTKRLLAFSRRRRLAVQATEVNRLVVDMVSLLGVATLGNRIRIETALDPDLWPAMAEPGQVEAALLNLALNSRDAMVEGGVLTLSTANETLREATDTAHPGDYVAITVTDTGAGMTDDVARRATEPFFTTKGSAGTGLGLSQVLTMVQESRGAIRIRTAPGQGTSVTLLLPRATTAADSAQPPERTARDDAPRRKALVVDDDADVLQVTADMLRQLGYCVIEANGGQAALDALESEGADAAVLALLDYAMPGMDGLTLAATLRERGFSGPLVMATGYADLSDAGRAQLGGLYSVLDKPYTFQELEALVARIEADEARMATAMETAR